MNNSVNNSVNNSANTAERRHHTVRLGFLWRETGWALGGLAGLLSAVALGESSAVDHLGAGPSLLLALAAGTAVALPVPHTFRLRADDQEITLSRLAVRRRYRWQDITRLGMDFDEDSETGSPRLTLRLHLAATRGPVLGTLPAAGYQRPRGSEPPELADLFTLLDRHGVRLDAPAYATLVLAAHGRPPLRRR